MPDRRMSIVPTMADLLDAPERALDLSPADAAAALARVEGLAAVLRTRLAAPGANGHDGEMLTAAEVASRLRLTVKQVYRRARRWPFTRRMSERTLRFDRRGFDLYMMGRQR